MTKLVHEVLAALEACLPMGNGGVALHEPDLSGKELEYVSECISTGWVSSAGEFVNRFEKELAEFTGAARAVAVVNGTAALHLCLKIIGVEKDDEVIVPTLTFVATANAVSYCGAVPHFADCDERTLGLDPQKLLAYLEGQAEVRGGSCFNKQTGRRIKAVVPVHIFGHPVDLDPLQDVCSRFCLELVEDAAESLGSYYKGRHTGTLGRVSALSFNGNKIATTGGGGALLTNDERLADLAKHISTTARVPHRWEIKHDTLGFNYRMPNINAALGCAQLERLPGFLRNKRALAERYAGAFSRVRGITFFQEPGFARSNYWLNALVLDNENASARDVLLERTNGRGIMTRPAWTMLHRLPMYKGCPRMDLAVAEGLEQRIVNIPSSSFLVDRKG